VINTKSNYCQNIKANAVGMANELQEKKDQKVKTREILS
jgi:hypothetical protein